MARLAGSEPPASPPEPPKEVAAEVEVEPSPMEEDETQKACVTRSHSSVRIIVYLIIIHKIFKNPMKQMLQYV